MAERLVPGRIHNVNPQARQASLAASRGDGDMVLDLQGAKYLSPAEQRLIAQRGVAYKREMMSREAEDHAAEEPWFYNPSNPASGTIPASVSFETFAKINAALKRIDRNMALTFHPVRHIYQLWYWKPGFSVYGNGWVMMKEFEPYRDSAYILKTIAYMDMAARGTSLAKEHDKLVERRKVAKMKRQQERRDRDAQKAGEVYDYTQIKNIGKGSKFATYG